MLLSGIKADPARFQFRETPYSEQTVEAIVSEGIDLAKFDPIPIIVERDPKTDFITGIVAGDGHSRFEAIRRLHERDRLPKKWLKAGKWHVPTRVVSYEEARTLSWTANLSRDDFTPCEQARVFQSMLDSGMSIDEVAETSHRTVNYIRQTLPLNGLCRDIKLAMTLSVDAGGIEAYIGKLIAAKFQQYGIQPDQQQQLWHRIFKHASLTSRFVRELMDRIGSNASERSKDGMLFELPSNIETIVSDLKDRAQMVRRAERGLGWLLSCKDSGILDDLPQLKKLMDSSGKKMLEQIRGMVESDAEVLSELCA